MTAADSYTDWERRQHERDNGRTAALAISHQLTARILAAGLDGLTAASCTQYLFARTGTAEQRLAAVNAWADAHHVTERFTDLDGRYCARLRIGEMFVTACAEPVSVEDPAEREDAGRELAKAAA